MRSSIYRRENVRGESYVHIAIKRHELQLHRTQTFSRIFDCNNPNCSLAYISSAKKSLKATTTVCTRVRLNAPIINHAIAVYWVHVRTSVRLSVYPFTYLSVHTCARVRLSVCPCVCLFLGDISKRVARFEKRCLPLPGKLPWRAGRLTFERRELTMGRRRLTNADFCLAS